MLPIADSMQPGRVAPDVDRPGCRSTLLRRIGATVGVGLVDDRLDVGALGDAEVLGDAGRAAGPVDVAALDHQLEDRVASRPALMPSVIEDVAAHQVGDAVGVADDHRVDGRVLELVGDVEDRAAHGTPAALPIGLRPTFVPWWMTTTWTLTPSLLRRSDSALIRGASARNVSPAVAPAETSSGVVSSSAPMTPTLTPLTVNTTDGVTHGGCLAGRGLDDVRGQEREVRPLPGAPGAASTP